MEIGDIAAEIVLSSVIHEGMGQLERDSHAGELLKVGQDIHADFRIKDCKSFRNLVAGS
jgi:hypothetical protein